MELVPLIGMALALSMDALAVTVGLSLAQGGLILSQRLRLAFYFGLFQGGMALLGWFGGGELTPLIRRYDHWVAFGLLVLAGGKMILESFQKGSLASNDTKDRTRGLAVLYLAFATSVDALAVGFSLGALKVAIIEPVIIITVVAAGMTISGDYLGRWLGAVVGRRAELAGGLILLIIGTRILITHLN